MLYIKGFVLDDVNELCYQVLADVNHFEAGEDACGDADAELVGFETDKQVQGFVSLFKAGETLSQHSNIKHHVSTSLICSF